MKTKPSRLSVLALAGVMNSHIVSAAGTAEVSSSAAFADGSYCRMNYPVIREDTLSDSTPGFTVSGDLIDFYGACDHDPLGKEEVQSKRLEAQHRFSVDFED